MNEKAIGLCLSGGGHRATVFALGVLLYLVDTGRHQRIRVVSSVSGGSLTSGFLATATKPLNEQSAEEVEDAIATIARRVTGRPSAFWLALAAVLALSLFWFLHLVGEISWFSFWESHLIFLGLLVVLALIAGALCGGTFWAWWGSWIYLGLLLVSLPIGVAIWWSPLPLSVRFAITLLTFSFPLLRCRVAEMAFAATIFKGRSHIRLAELPSVPRYVFCATDVYSAQHVHFTHDLLHVPLVGVGLPRSLRVTSAVQMSANFPVAFPYRFLWPWRYKFCLGERQPLFMMLTDGGVADNMAMSWFTEGWVRAAQLESQLSKRKVQKHCEGQREAGLRSQIDALKSDVPDSIIVVNSSEPYAWVKRENWSAPVWNLFRRLLMFLQYVLPLWGEGLMLLKVNSAMYEHLGLSQKRRLQKHFLSQPHSGALISIGDHPNDLKYALAQPEKELQLFLTSLGADARDIEDYVQRARRMLFSFELPGNEEREVEKQFQHLQQRKAELERARYSRILADGSSQIKELSELSVEAMKDAYIASLIPLAQEGFAVGEDAERARRMLFGFEPPSDEEREVDSQLEKVRKVKIQLERARQNRILERGFEQLQESVDLNVRAIESAGVATTFRPLTKTATTTLLAHGYRSAMANCHMLLNWPMVDEVPNPRDFEPLADGMRRARRPRPTSEPAVSQ